MKIKSAIVQLFLLKLACAAPLAASTSDLGDLMYLGDSITHGTYSPTHRWSLHQVFVDNGFTYNAVGVHDGNYDTVNEKATGSKYGDVTFSNVHSAESGSRAFDISGNLDGEAIRNPARFQGSNITNWLNQSDTMTNGASYETLANKGTHPGGNGAHTSTYSNYHPDTYVMMIGTNDFSGSAARTPEELRSSVNEIYQSAKSANANAQLIITTTPVARSADSTVNTKIEQYNTVDLRDWAEGKSDVIIADINRGLIDVSLDGYKAVQGTHLFKDSLHPTTQGSLIMASNIAKDAGWAGRSAGQERKDGSALSVHFYDAGSTPQFSDAALVQNGFNS